MLPNNTLYLKINCKGKFWPMKFKCAALDGVFELYVSFEHILPNAESSIMSTSIKAEYLYKFKKPKNYDPNWCFIALHSRHGAKVEIKVWFTEPSLERWRAV